MLRLFNSPLHVHPLSTLIICDWNKHWNIKTLLLRPHFMVDRGDIYAAPPAVTGEAIFHFNSLGTTQ